VTDRKHLYTLLRVAHTWCEKNLPGWTEEDYRGVLQRHGATESSGKFSASTMTSEQIDAALREFQSKGFQVRGKRGKSDGWREPRLAKLRALWMAMHQDGIVRNVSEEAMQHWCKRAVPGLQHVKWATSQQLNAAIEAMKDMQARSRRTGREDP
jgi:hypothetical protein